MELDKRLKTEEQGGESLMEQDPKGVKDWQG